MIALLVGNDGRLFGDAAETLRREGYDVLAADHARDAVELAEALPALALLVWTAELRDGPSIETAALIADRWPEAVTLLVVEDAPPPGKLGALERVSNVALCTRTSLRAAVLARSPRSPTLIPAPQRDEFPVTNHTRG